MKNSVVEKSNPEKVKAEPFPGPYTVEAIFPDKAKGHNFEPHVCLVANHPQYGKVRIAEIPDAPSEDSEEMATATLFGAAPDMLAALKGLDLRCWADVLNPCWDNRPSDIAGEHWGGVGKACPACNARAAIAKASGGAA
jgi:hypothetical protein